MRKKIIYSFAFILLIAACFSAYKFQIASKEQKNNIQISEVQGQSNQTNSSNAQEPKQEKIEVKEIKFVGPRENIPADAPKDYGFWSFAVAAPGALSRSGQPTLKDFQWLKENGWKSDINLRVENDHEEQADDSKIPGFSQLGLNYLRIQMLDGAIPTKDQAEQFLNFMTNPENLPAHVHCRGGIGRAGTMVALYRYSIQGWPMDKAIEESRAFQGGVSDAQKKWLISWAANHEPGVYNLTNSN